MQYSSLFGWAASTQLHLWRIAVFRLTNSISCKLSNFKTEKWYNPLHVLQYNHCPNYPPLGWLCFYPMPPKLRLSKLLLRAFTFCLVCVMKNKVQLSLITWWPLLAVDLSLMVQSQLQLWDQSVCVCLLKYLVCAWVDQLFFDIVFGKQRWYWAIARKREQFDMCFDIGLLKSGLINGLPIVRFTAGRQCCVCILQYMLCSLVVHVQNFAPTVLTFEPSMFDLTNGLTW